MPPNKQNQPKHEDIARRAFEIWVKEGQPVGSDQRHWLQAEAELKKGSDAKSPAPAANIQKNNAVAA